MVDRSSRSDGPSGTRGSDRHRSHNDECGHRDHRRGSERHHKSPRARHSPRCRESGERTDLLPRREGPALSPSRLILLTIRNPIVLRGRLRMSGLLPLIITITRGHRLIIGPCPLHLGHRLIIGPCLSNIIIDNVRA